MTQEIVYVRRLKDGAILDIPKRDLEQTLKRGFELFEDKKEETLVVDEQPIFDLMKKVYPNNCDLCQKDYKTKKLLDKHIKTAHR